MEFAQHARVGSVRSWLARLPALPAMPALSALSWRGARAVTAVMVGEVATVVRVEARASGLHLVAAETGPANDLSRCKSLFRGGVGLLVLRSEDRFLLMLDQPQVPAEELHLALRWPIGEALGMECEELLTAAVPLYRSNEAARPQVLGIAARLDKVKAQLDVLQQAGIKLRSIDVADTALRGMVLMQPQLAGSAFTLALMGSTMYIGLIQEGSICALRSVPLPERDGQSDARLALQLALNARRTFDHYGRQALMTPRGGAPAGIGRAVASVASLSVAGQDTFCQALPEPPELFDLFAFLQAPPSVRARCTGSDELTALACVAAARLFDTGPVTARAPAPPLELAA